MRRLLVAIAVVGVFFLVLSVCNGQRSFVVPSVAQLIVIFCAV